MNKQLDDVMTKFFQRSVKQNSATGVPKPFEFSVDVAELKGKPFKDERPSITPQPAQRSVYPAAPVVISVNPTQGVASGGTHMNIVGENFAVGDRVYYDGAPEAAGGTFTDAQHIMSVTPAHSAGQVDILVENTLGMSDELVNAFTFINGPAISYLNPISGPTAGNTNVEIGGDHFVSGCTVKFGATPATGVVFNDVQHIHAVTPAHAAGLVDVTVTNSPGFDVTKSNAFTFIGPPSINEVTTDLAMFYQGLIGWVGGIAGGQSVVVLGSGFQNGATITFGGVAATSVVFANSGRLNCVVPAHAAGFVDVKVTNPDTQNATKTNGFKYQNPPESIHSFGSPSMANNSVDNIGGEFRIGGVIIPDYQGNMFVEIVATDIANVAFTIPAFGGYSPIINGTSNIQIFAHFLPPQTSGDIYIRFHDVMYYSTVFADAHIHVSA